MTNILLLSYHSNNRGDESAIRGLMTSLKEAIPDAKFTLLASDVKVSSEIFNKDNVLVLPWFPPIFSFKLSNFTTNRKVNIILNSPIILTQIGSGLFEVGRAFLWTIFRRYREKPKISVTAGRLKILQKMAEADLILFSPAGPYFGDLYLSHFSVHVVQILLAKILNKPVMICAPSMGPFFKTRKICKYVLNKVDVISLREHFSFQMVSTLQLSNPLIFVTADCGVLQHPTKSASLLLPKEIRKPRKDPLVGITVYSGVQRLIDYELYKKTMAEIADYVIREMHAKIIFIPQWYGSFSDMPLITEIIGLMQFKEGVFLTPEHYQADQMHGIFGELDLIIATRYHSAVLASTMNVPCVLIGYEHKAKGFMNHLGLNDCLLDIRELNIENLVDKVKYVWNRQDQIKSLLSAQIPQVQKKALYNVTVAIQLLDFYKKNQVKKRFKDYVKEKNAKHG